MQRTLAWGRGGCPAQMKREEMRRCCRGETWSARTNRKQDVDWRQVAGETWRSGWRITRLFLSDYPSLPPPSFQLLSRSLSLFCVLPGSDGCSQPPQGLPSELQPLSCRLRTCQPSRITSHMHHSQRETTRDTMQICSLCLYLFVYIINICNWSVKLLQATT